MKIKTQDELIAELKNRVAGSTQTAVAEEIGVSLFTLNQILLGRRDISARVARLMGFQKEVVFRKVA